MYILFVQGDILSVIGGGVSLPTVQFSEHRVVHLLLPFHFKRRSVLSKSEYISLRLKHGTPLMAGNWKMNLDHLEAIISSRGLAMELKDHNHDYARCSYRSPFTDIRTVRPSLLGSASSTVPRTFPSTTSLQAKI